MSFRHWKKSAPILSILLAKTMRGTLYLSPWRHTVSVCGSTPWLESRTTTAPSRTRSERSTSMVKSTWPGVSMMFRRLPFQNAAIARRRDDPADAERLAPHRADFDRHLVGGAADAPRTHLDRRHHVVERLLEHLQRIALGLGFDGVEGAVDDRLGRRLLALVHD